MVKNQPGKNFTNGLNINFKSVIMSRILIIEDEASIRRVLTKILSEESDTYLVDEAEDGLLGLEKIKNTDYDLVLCDIKMPKMDGVELLEAVKKIKPEIPMVMISGHGDMETAIQTMRLGALQHSKRSFPPRQQRDLEAVGLGSLTITAGLWLKAHPIKTIR